MKVREISERWAIIGVSILMLLALALLVHGLVRNKQDAKDLGKLVLDRTMDGQRWRMETLTGLFSSDIDRQTTYVSAHAHPTDQELIDRWLPLLRSRYAIEGIGIANDRGDERILRRADSTWQFISTSRSAIPTSSTRMKWPLRRPWALPSPVPIPPPEDPRKAIWFSQALEDRHDDSAWSLSDDEGGEGMEALHLSILVRGRTDSDAYRVVHLDIDAKTMLEPLNEWAPGMYTMQFSWQGRPLLPLDSSKVGQAWRSVLKDWMDERPTTSFDRTIAGKQWLGRIVPFDLNGTRFYIGTLIDMGPVQQWNQVSRSSLWWVLTVLLVLGGLLAVVVAQSRKADLRVRNQERHSSLQARDLAMAIGQREVLDREVHHRVKNNLQVVSSLLNLQAQRIEGTEARAEFSRGKRRIDSMALVHHKLYRQKDLSAVDLHVFLDDLAKAVSAMFEPDSRAVSHTVDTSGIRSDADTSIQLGMILCELLANCHQHAFPYATGGHIEIRVRRAEGDLYILTVKDNGKGINPDQVSGVQLGLEIVEALADQLDGTLRTLTSEGTLVEVIFKMQAPLAQVAQARS